MRLCIPKDPEKLLAVHSGLSQYGRNNISYIPGMGSFFLLSAFYTDVPYQDGDWNDIQMMKACDKCTKCIDACPTGAITAERFLINAERCITYQNELKTEESFPDWIETSSHNSMIGCLYCQINCPQNQRYLNNIIEYEDFNLDETKYILEKRDFDSLPESLVNKLERFNLKMYYHILARNLKVLIDQHIQ